MIQQVCSVDYFLFDYRPFFLYPAETYSDPCTATIIMRFIANTIYILLHQCTTNSHIKPTTTLFIQLNFEVKLYSIIKFYQLLKSVGGHHKMNINYISYKYKLQYYNYIYNFYNYILYLYCIT